MKCEHCRQWLNQYIDYELTDEESAWVEEHIASCGECRDDYNALVYTKEAVHSIPDYDPPYEFSQSWKSQIEYPNNTNVVAMPKNNRGRKTLRSLVAVAAVLGIAIASVQTYNAVMGSRGDGVTPQWLSGGSSNSQQESGADGDSGQSAEPGEGAGQDTQDNLDEQESGDESANIQDSATFGVDNPDSSTFQGSNSNTQGDNGVDTGSQGQDNQGSAGSNDIRARSLSPGAKDIVVAADQELFTQGLKEAGIAYTKEGEGIKVSITAENVDAMREILAAYKNNDTIADGDSLQITFE